MVRMYGYEMLMTEVGYTCGYCFAYCHPKSSR